MATTTVARRAFTDNGYTHAFAVTIGPVLPGGYGPLTAAQNTALNINLSAALVTGHLRAKVWYTTE